MTDPVVEESILKAKDSLTPEVATTTSNTEGRRENSPVDGDSKNQKPTENSDPLAPRKNKNRQNRNRGKALKSDENQTKEEKENLPEKKPLSDGKVEGVEEKKAKEGENQESTNPTTTTSSSKITGATTTTTTTTIGGGGSDRDPSKKKRNQNRRDKRNGMKNSFENSNGTDESGVVINKDKKKMEVKESNTSSTSTKASGPETKVLEDEKEQEKTNLTENGSDKKSKRKRNRSKNHQNSEQKKDSVTNPEIETEDITSLAKKQDDTKTEKTVPSSSSSSPTITINDTTTTKPSKESRKQRQNKKKEEKKQEDDEDKKSAKMSKTGKSMKEGGGNNESRNNKVDLSNQSAISFAVSNTNTTTNKNKTNTATNGQETTTETNINKAKNNNNNPNNKGKDGRNKSTKTSTTSVATTTSSLSSSTTTINTNNNNNNNNNASTSTSTSTTSTTTYRNNINNNNNNSRNNREGMSSSNASSIISVNRDETIMKSKENFYYDHVMIPSKFEGWIRNSLEQCNAILAKVKEKSNARSIIIEQHVGDREVEYRFTVTAHGKDACKQAIALLEIHLKNQEVIMRKKDHISRINNDISVVQEKVAAGLRIEFEIDPTLTGLAIGKKGEHINKVKNVTGVDVIDVNNGNIRIVGPNIDSVNHARSMMEIISVDLNLTYDLIQPVLLRHINDIKVRSECLQVRVINKSSASEENPKGIYIRDGQIFGLENGVYEPTDEVAIVRLIGTKTQVDSAKKLLDTQKDYIHQFAEIQLNETAARQRRREVNVGEGRNRNGGKK